MEEHLTLYRKYRPATFDEVVGQEHVTVTIRNAIKSGKIAHAYLFSGPRGTGKTTIARLIAKGLNCVNAPTDSPCASCEACVGIQRGSYLDVIEIDAASNRGIDDIRSLREHVRFAPAQGGWKVYIIDEVHMLTADASNALLKTLEEPPQRTVFILATTEKHKVLPTIQSRCQVFDFRRLPTNLIVERLKEVCDREDIAADDKALLLIARKARGGLRDALVLLEQARSFTEATDASRVLSHTQATSSKPDSTTPDEAPDSDAEVPASGRRGRRIDTDVVYRLIGYLPDAVIVGILRALATRDVFSAIEKLRELDDAGYELKTLPGLLQHAIIQTLIHKRTGTYSADWVLEQESTEELAALLDEPTMIRFIDILDEAEKTMRFGEDPLLALEVAFLRQYALSAGVPSVTAAAPGMLARTQPASGTVPASGSVSAPAASPAQAGPRSPAAPLAPSAPRAPGIAAARASASHADAPGGFQGKQQPSVTESEASRQTSLVAEPEAAARAQGSAMAAADRAGGAHETLASGSDGTAGGPGGGDSVGPTPGAPEASPSSGVVRATESSAGASSAGGGLASGVSSAEDSAEGPTADAGITPFVTEPPQAAQAQPDVQAVQDYAAPVEDSRTLKTLWRQLLDNDKLKKRLSLHYHLTEAVPVALDESTLTIKFKKTVSATWPAVLTEENLALVNSLLPKVFGKNVVLRVEGAPPAAAPQARQPGEPPPANLAPPEADTLDVPVDEVASELAEEFGGVIDPDV
jgi:DNA polymerase-3 subunit gamma/tau